MTELESKILSLRRAAELFRNQRDAALAKAEEFEKAYKQSEAQIATLLEAANILGVKINETGDEKDELEPDEPSRRGRKPGAISMEWRNALGIVHALGRPASYHEIGMAAAKAGINSSLPGIRDRVRYYVERGILTGDADLGFSVSDETVAKFGLMKPPKLENHERRDIF